MSALDIFVILALGGGALVGFVRGFVHELLSLFAWVAAVAMLKLFHTQLHEGLATSVGSSAASVPLLATKVLLRYVRGTRWPRAACWKSRTASVSAASGTTPSSMRCAMRSRALPMARCLPTSCRMQRIAARCC